MVNGSNTLIPNTFQHPNAYIDWLAYYLTPEEEKVLNKAVREILGWRDKIASRQARISLSVFVDGKVNPDTGERYCMGCGLGKSAVRAALEGLDKYKILCKAGRPTQRGQMYEIQDDYTQVDLPGLQDRRAEWDASQKERTEKARGVLSDKRRCIVGQNTGGIVGQTTGVLSDNNKETHLETHEKPNKETPLSKNPQETLDDTWPSDGGNGDSEPQPPPTEDDGIMSAKGPLEMAAACEKANGGKRSTTIPAVAGGASDYDEAIKEFCVMTNQPEPANGARREWIKVFESIADKEGFTAALIVAAVLNLPEKSKRWSIENDIWTSPAVSSFKAKVSTVARRLSVGQSPTGKREVEIRNA